jgi:hypothetical protein
LEPLAKRPKKPHPALTAVPGASHFNEMISPTRNAVNPFYRSLRLKSTLFSRILQNCQ